MIVLGIETTCDETAAAVVRSGQELISNVVYSQIATHQPYGGVVPELASREHLRAIVPVVRKALEDAGKTYDTIDAVAVTQLLRRLWSFNGNAVIATAFNDADNRSDFFNQASKHNDDLRSNEKVRAVMNSLAMPGSHRRMDPANNLRPRSLLQSGAK